MGTKIWVQKFGFKRILSPNNCGSKIVGPTNFDPKFKVQIDFGPQNLGPKKGSKRDKIKQAGAKLGQAQLKLRLEFN